MLMQDLLHQWMGKPDKLPSSSGPITPCFETSRASRGSSAEYLESSSPVEDMRKRLRVSRAPAWGTKRRSGRGVLEREKEVIERRHLDKEALLDRRRRDLQSAIDPTVPKTLKGPDAPTESERTAHEITHLPPAPSFETCTLRRGIEARHVRLNLLERDEKPIVDMGFAVRRAEPTMWQSMTIWGHFWQSSTLARDA